MQRFDLPRLSHPFRGLLCMPCIMPPRGVTTDQIDEKGEIKPRQTIDQSAPHPVGPIRRRDGSAMSWPTGEDPSVNGHTDQQALPSFDYFQLKFLARQSSILSTSGLPITQSAQDAAAYYEQAARTSLQHGQQLQWVLRQGMQYDSRLVFGFAAEPSTMNRFSFHVSWRTRHALQREQLAWEQFWAGWQASI